MTDSDPIERAFAIARAGLDPQASARDRVWSRLETAFPELAGGSARPADRGEPNDAATPVAGARGPGFWRLVKATGATGAASAALLVAGGFAAGYSMRSFSHEAQAAPPPVTALDARFAHSENAPAPLAAPVTAEALAGPPPAASLPVSPTDSANARATNDARTEAERPARSVHKAKPATSDLDAELVLLRRAERAIRSDTPELALALLDELDQQHPASPLSQERDATRAMASCRSNAVNAPDNARAFLAAHPESVYRARVETLCELVPRNRENSAQPTDSPAPDTNAR